MTTTGRTSARNRTRLVLSAAALATTLLPAPPAAAVNIVMSYNAGSSIEPGADATGANLTAIMTYIEGYYQDIFQDSYTLNISFWWDNAANFSNPTGTLAVHQLQTQGGVPNRETSATIRFNNSFTWFMDATPENDSEFNMGQTLWRDLTATQRSNDFNFSGTIPGTLEVGFSGAAIAGEGATGATDLLTVALHEVGHALGMSEANNTTVAQTADNDYDFNSAYVFGSTIAAETATSTNEAHLDLQFGVMQPTIPQSTRRRPGHADLFAMAAGNAFTSTGLDVPRREAYGGFDWNNDANWSGNKVPGSGDETHVRNPGSVVVMSLSADGVAGDLFLEEGAWITTNHKLDVSDDTTVAGTGTRMRVQSSGELETADLRLHDAGTVDLIGGLVDIIDDAVIDAGTFVEGYGTITLGSNFNNNGTIRANDATGNLTLAAAAAGVWDLDGTSGAGIVQASSGNITLTGDLFDAFDGTMTVSSGRTITFNSGWTLGSGGVLNLNGTTAVASIGGASTIAGQISITGDARFTGATTFNSTASVAVNSGETLSLNGATTFNGGSFTGLGEMFQNGNATVAANTTIDVNTYNWDGAGAAVTTINDGVTFTITSTFVDTASNVYNGTLNVNGGTAAVNTTSPWTMAGTLTLATATGTASLNGSPVTVTGALNANGTNTAIVNADATFSSSATVAVTSGTDLVLNVATFNGGAYTGLGEITQSGDWTVGANTTIATSTLDWGNSALLDSNSITVNSNVLLTVNSASLGSATNDFRGVLQLNSGDLTVNTPWTLAAFLGTPLFTPGGTLNLNNTGSLPVVGGQPLTVGGTINTTGTGAISSDITFLSTANVNVPLATDILSLSGPIEFNGGSYTGLGEIRPIGAATVAANTTMNVGTYNLDGGGGSTLTVNSGVTFTLNVSAIEDTPAGTYGGTTNLNSGTLAVNTLPSWTMAGTLNMNKPGAPVPILTGTSEIIHTGAINATNAATISAPYRFSGIPSLNIAANNFVISNTFSSNAGATLSKTGAGTLVVSATQSHAPGATINVNAGTLHFTSNADSGAGANLRVTLNPTGHATFAVTQRLDSLIISNNADAVLGAGGSRVLYTHLLSITGTGFLELNDNDAIVDYAGASPFPTILGYVTTGYNAGNWNGAGIRSNNASLQPNDLTALALAENSLLGLANFAGQIVDATSLLIKYTWYGDANFNGRVDRDDYALLDRGRSKGLTGWNNGDFNYSGTITTADYLLIDRSFLLQSGTLAPDFRTLLAERESQFGPDYAAALLTSVPEPSSLLAACGLALPLVRRRRRRAS
jgi:autotransporter-associated beta strand protein